MPQRMTDFIPLELGQTWTLLERDEWHRATSSPLSHVPQMATAALPKFGQGCSPELEVQSQAFWPYLGPQEAHENPFVRSPSTESGRDMVSPLSVRSPDHSLVLGEVSHETLEVSRDYPELSWDNQCGEVRTSPASPRVERYRLQPEDQNAEAPNLEVLTLRNTYSPQSNEYRGHEALSQEHLGDYNLDGSSRLPEGDSYLRSEENTEETQNNNPGHTPI